MGRFILEYILDWGHFVYIKSNASKMNHGGSGIMHRQSPSVSDIVAN